jgi:hypothetical protein
VRAVPVRVPRARRAAARLLLVPHRRHVPLVEVACADQLPASTKYVVTTLILLKALNVPANVSGDTSREEREQKVLAV